MLRCHGWQRATHVQGWTVFRKEPGGGAVMSRDGRYSARSQEAVRLCPGMDGIPQGARRRCGYVQDGRYSARSQGWRCGYVQDVRYAAMPWMAKSNACPWMDGLKIALCIIFLFRCTLKKSLLFKKTSSRQVCGYLFSCKQLWR